MLLNYPTDITMLCQQEQTSLLLRDRQGERHILELFNDNGVHLSTVGSFELLIGRAREKEQFLHFLIDSRLRADNQHTGHNQVFEHGIL
jgi:hypothetical protein